MNTKTYAELLAEYKPRIVTTQEQCNAYADLIKNLLIEHGNVSSDLGDFLALLEVLREDFETRQPNHKEIKPRQIAKIITKRHWIYIQQEY